MWFQTPDPVDRAHAEKKRLLQALRSCREDQRTLTTERAALDARAAALDARVAALQAQLQDAVGAEEEACRRFVEDEEGVRMEEAVDRGPEDGTPAAHTQT